MTFADLFKPFPDPPTAQTGFADRQDRRTPTSNVTGKQESRIREGENKVCLPIGKESGLCLSRLSAPALVPLQAPFVEGRRYREAGATEASNRLDLYVADPAGTWLRRHGVLLSA